MYGTKNTSTFQAVQGTEQMHMMLLDRVIQKHVAYEYNSFFLKEKSLFLAVFHFGLGLEKQYIP